MTNAMTEKARFFTLRTSFRMLLAEVTRAWKMRTATRHDGVEVHPEGDRG